MSEKYNGYTNYETWAVSLAIDNDEGQADYWAEAADEVLAEGMPKYMIPLMTTEQYARYTLGKRIKNELRDQLPELSSPFDDLLNSAFDKVNWSEVADGLLAEATERAAK